MEAKRKKRYLITFLILILGVIAFLLLNICIGTVQIPLSELKNAVMDGDSKLDESCWISARRAALLR